MKKQLTGLSIFIVMMIAAASFTAFTQQEKNKNKKEQQQKQDKPAKAEREKDKDNQPGNSQNKGNAGNKNDKGRNNENKGNSGQKDEKGNSNNNNRKHTETVYGYSWDRETFKDRKKLRNQEKVTLCHKFNRNDEPPVTISVSSNALKAHLDHGDVRGDCPEIDNTRYSNDFLNRRRDYYNDLQNTQEQVLYSRSILDYALQRLSGSRLQLATMQANNVPANELERKRVVVMELEQNVSTLEILLGAAANLLANKLQ